MPKRIPPYQAVGSRACKNPDCANLAGDFDNTLPGHDFEVTSKNVLQRENSCLRSRNPRWLRPGHDFTRRIQMNISIKNRESLCPARFRMVAR
jgi:hypothetical protein